MTIAFVGALLLVLIIAAFALQNSAPVNLQFLAWSWQWDVGRVIAAAAVTGALVGLLVVGLDDLRLRLRLRQANRRAARLEGRLASVESERDRLVERLEALEGSAAREAAAHAGDGPQPRAMDREDRSTPPASA